MLVLWDVEYSRGCIFWGENFWLDKNGVWCVLWLEFWYRYGVGWWYVTGLWRRV